MLDLSVLDQLAEVENSVSEVEVLLEKTYKRVFGKDTPKYTEFEFGEYGKIYTILRVVCFSLDRNKSSKFLETIKIPSKYLLVFKKSFGVVPYINKQGILNEGIFPNDKELEVLRTLFYLIFKNNGFSVSEDILKDIKDKMQSVFQKILEYNKSKLTLTTDVSSEETDSEELI